MSRLPEASDNRPSRVARQPAARPAGRSTLASAPGCENIVLSPTTVEQIPARPSGPKARAVRTRLSDRDLSVLHTLATVRLATGAQLQRLLITDGSDRTQARRARALLQRLTDLHLVVRLGRRVGGVRAGSSGFIYGLSGDGQAVLGVEGIRGGRRRRVYDTSPAFEDHVLAVTELFVQITEAGRVSGLELLAFQGEPSAWRRFPGATGLATTLKPDAFVRLGLEDLERSAFIEVDLGTESSSVIQRKLQVHVDYFHSGIEQAAHDVHPTTIWLANSQYAADRISSAIRKLSPDVRHLFEVGLLPDALRILTATAEAGRMA